MPTEVEAPPALASDVVATLLGEVEPVAAAAARLRVAVRPGVPEVPPRPPDVSAFGVDAWRGPEWAAFRVGDVVATIERRHATVAGPSDAIVGALRVLRPHVLAALLGGERVFVLHAALVQRPPVRVLVVGVSRQGKSTTALAALEAAGWDALADDVVLAREEADGVAVATLGFPLHVPSDLGAVVTAAAAAVPNDARERHVVAVARAPWRPIHAVAVVGHGGAPATVATRLAAPAVMAPLLEAYPGNRDEALRRRYLDVVRLAGRLPVWRLELGVDPRQRLRTTAGALDVIAAGSVSRTT